MDARNRRSREIQEAIRLILRTDWNPIGFEVPSDEYDNEIGGVHKLLARSASVEEIAAHLATRDSDSTSKQLEDVATKLSAIDVSLDPDPKT